MSPTSLANGEVPLQGVRELWACKESTVLLSSLTPWGGSSPFVKEVGQTFPHRFVRDQTRRRGAGSLANNTHWTWQIVKSAVNLTISGIQNLLLKLETHP